MRQGNNETGDYRHVPVAAPLVTTIFLYFGSKNNYIQILINDDIHQFRHVLLKSVYFCYSHSLISAPPKPGAHP